MKNQPINPAEILIREMVAFGQARLRQYQERTGQTHREAINTILATYGEAKNEEAVRALVDPIVDPEYRSDVAERMRQEREAYVASLKRVPEE